MSECTVLLSVGRNPVSGRPRLPPAEAAAIALALRAGLRPRLLHAGPACAAEVLRRGLGLGAAALDILAIGPEDDPVAPLLERLTTSDPGLLLAGARAETGEGSGILPYLLGAALGRPLIDGCLDLQRGATVGWIVRSGLPGGARRVVAVSAATILSVGTTVQRAPLGSQSAADARCVRIDTVKAPRDERHNRQSVPARSVPRPIRAAVAAPTSAGCSLDDPDQAAAAILKLLRSAGLA